MNQNCEITLEIGGMPILLHMQDASFRQLLALRYAGFVGSPSPPKFEFDVELTAPLADDPDEDVRVQMRDGVWRLRRGDFRAHWDPRAGRGHIRQSANPYSIDSVLRIVHTLILAREGGFLLHSAGAIRNGRAFLFSGVSGAGKTTISRLAPPDVTLLTDEISYIRLDPTDITPAELRSRRVGARGRKLLGADRLSVFPEARAGKQDRAHGENRCDPASDSTADCEKSFQRTRIRSANMLRMDKDDRNDNKGRSESVNRVRAGLSSAGPLIQIQSAVA